MLLQQAQQLLKYPPSPTHQGLQHWRRAMQPVVVSSARRQDLWEAGGVAIEVVAVEGMVVVAVEGTQLPNSGSLATASAKGVP